MTHCTSTPSPQRSPSPIPTSKAGPSFTSPTPSSPFPPPPEEEDTDLSFTPAPEPSEHYDLTPASPPSTGSSTPSASPSSGLPLSVNNLARLEASTMGEDAGPSLYPGSAEELDLYFERMKRLGQFPSQCLRSATESRAVGGVAGTPGVKSSAGAECGSGGSETGTVCSGEGMWAATLAERAMRDEGGIGRPADSGGMSRTG